MASAPAEVVLGALESSRKRSVREEEEEWHCLSHHRWRHDDLLWMRSQKLHYDLRRHFRHLKYIWRDEDMVQRNLENARSLWLRSVEKNRRDVEEKSAQLKEISTLAAIFSGFAIVALTQFVQSDTSFLVLGGLYGVLTAIVEGLMTLSMVTCMLILGCILKIGKTYVNEQAEQEFIFQCLEFCQNYEEGVRPPCPKRTLEAFWESRCESSWQFAFTCFSIGVSLFLVNMIAIGWIMYSVTSEVTSSLYVTLFGLAIVIWCCVQYYWSKYVRRKQFVDNRADIDGDHSGLPYDWYLAPNIRPTQ